MGFEHSNSVAHASDLKPGDFDTWKAVVRSSFHLERVRVREGYFEGHATVNDLARPPYRWTHEESFWNDGLRFDIWVNWDGRVRIEHDGQVVLQMGAAAGEIMRAIAAREKAQKSCST